METTSREQKNSAARVQDKESVGFSPVFCLPHSFIAHQNILGLTDAS
jgi:hypothetical protein